ncbi:MAG: hypothetical protein A2W25_04330 [candidate division Zixibacteria bacterium RBG_16_53_22]|nr:MAG: hypothetical protein A2W25_04330 [candidate division Zixibacteria bacterium RBG_16_53_22]
MLKPKWLKKDKKDKPWKYPKTIYPDGKPIEIEVYNFTISMFGEQEASDIKDAIKWINEQGDK